VGNTGFRRYLKTISDEHFAIDPDKVAKEKKFDGIFVLRTNTDLNPLEATLLQAIVDCGANLPNSQAPALDPADLPQARRDHPRPRVLQLSRAGAEEGAGRPHRGVRSLRFLAADHRRPRLADRDRNRTRRQALRSSPRAPSRAQPRPACGWRRAAADRARGRGPLIPARSQDVVPSRRLSADCYCRSII